MHLLEPKKYLHMKMKNMLNQGDSGEEVAL
jgi:hypothetical protein